MSALELPAPTAVDRVVEYFSPRAGLARRHARARIELADRFTAGYNGARGDRKATKHWDTTVGSADSDTTSDLPSLRGRSSDLERNAPLATGAISTVVTNAVGTGLIARPSIDRELLGLSDDEADEWESHAARWFRLWAESKSGDLSRTLPFSAQQALVLRSLLERGDTFAVRRMIERPGDPFATKVQLIEADRCSNPQGQQESRELTAGIRRDPETGEPVSYYFQDPHPGETRVMQRGPTKWIEVPAFGKQSGDELVLHIFDRKRIGQSRGVPMLAPVIELLRQLTQYTENELNATLIQSLFTVFIKTEAAGGDMAGLAAMDGDDADATAAAKEDGEIRLGGGAIVDLRPGEDVVMANPARPVSNFDPFLLAVVRQIGVGVEIPYEVLIKHFTASYSAARAALLEAWKLFRNRRHLVVTLFCNPVYRWVITEAVARGYLEAPGFAKNKLIRNAWLGVEWHGPAPGQIDPLKEVLAAKEKIALVISTGAAETAEINGGDYEANIRQRAREVRQLRAAGLDVEPVAERIVTQSTQTDATDPAPENPDKSDSDKEAA